MLFDQLSSIPKGVEAIQQAIAQLDECFLQGFVGSQYRVLEALPQLFAGTPLEGQIDQSLQAIARNEFLESHFVGLAAVRVALQGTLYDALQHHVQDVLQRPPRLDDPALTVRPSQPNPLLDSTRHWLMEIALAGFARLEAGTLLSFLPTLAQLRAVPAAMHLSALLTGFMNEMLAALPIKDSDQVPLLRWCDLWSVAMLNALGLAEPPAPTLVTGTLAPLGVELRQHSRTASMIVYSLLSHDNCTRLVRQTWSAFKVAAIQSDEIWLLFPEAQTLLQSLTQGKTLAVRDLPVLPSGDMLWSEDRLTGKPGKGKKYDALDLAVKHCAPGSNVMLSALPALQRHPIQIAEPVAFTDYTINGNALHLPDGTALPLDRSRSSLTYEALEATTTLFGLLRYDAGQWAVQPLAAGNLVGKFEIVGQAGVELLNKPPKSNTVSTLKERSSRLLRR